MKAPNPWVIWQERCSLALCPTSTRDVLAEFVQQRFGHYLRTAHLPWGASARIPLQRDTWHLFESHLRLHSTRAGKTYKHWLMDRADDASSMERLEAGATLLIRSVVREYVRCEIGATPTESLDTETDDPDECTVSALDLLPDDKQTPADAVEQREMQPLVERLSVLAFDGMGVRQRIALLARERGWALSSPPVTAAAGCAKSVLITAYHSALQHVASTVRTLCPREDRSALAHLAVAVFPLLIQRILLWGRSEIRCAVLFNPVEGSGVQAERRGGEDGKP